MSDRVQVQGIVLGQNDAAVEAKYAAETAESAWTVGTKPLRYIRVDFSDAPGDPLPLAQARDWHLLGATVVAGLSSAGFYVVGFEELWHHEALEQVLAAGNLTDDYELLATPADGSEITCGAIGRRRAAGGPKRPGPCYRYCRAQRV